jgi:hypothetical protein
MITSGSDVAATAGAAIPIARAADTTANEIFFMIRSIVEGRNAPQWNDNPTLLR